MTDSTRPPRTQCGHWLGPESRYCRSEDDLHPYVIGVRCPLHTPAALQGKPEPQPGPGIPAYRKQKEDGQ